MTLYLSNFLSDFWHFCSERCRSRSFGQSLGWPFVRWWWAEYFSTLSTAVLFLSPPFPGSSGKGAFILIRALSRYIRVLNPRFFFVISCSHVLIRRSSSFSSKNCRHSRGMWLQIVVHGRPIFFLIFFFFLCPKSCSPFYRSSFCSSRAEVSAFRSRLWNPPPPPLITSLEGFETR